MRLDHLLSTEKTLFERNTCAPFDCQRLSFFMFFDFIKHKSIIFSGLKIDKEGLPYLIGFKELGYYSYPVTVSTYGLYSFQLYKITGKDRYLNSAVKCGKFLVKRGIWEDGWFLWRHDFPNRFLSMEPGWICGLTQALAGALFLYLGDVKDDFLKLADASIEPLFHPVEKGGLANRINDYHFLEEYPSSPPSATLNGFMYILLVLHLFGERGNKKAKDAFKSYSENLEKNLYRYDTGFWSLYDLWKVKRLASKEYHYLHISLLDSLHRITGNRTFQFYREKWLGYWKNPLSHTLWTITKIKGKTSIIFRRL